MQVDYYGAPTPLKSLAGISAPESTMLVVQPYDKTAMQAIEKAIMQSDIGATPSNDGNLIRINIPALTAVSAPACGSRSWLSYHKLCLPAVRQSADNWPLTDTFELLLMT